MRFVIVTGMSGAGKSTALKLLEDADYYCVDNLPISLIKPFAQIAADGSAAEFEKFAVGIDIRNTRAGGDLKDTVRELDNLGLAYEILFLDASDEMLIMRFKETRRTHPLAGKDGEIGDGITRERGELMFLRERADYVIDTTDMLTRELRAELVRIFIEEQRDKNLHVIIQSFGFKFGIPADSDLVIDVRFLPNPYYIPELRSHTGNDPEIVNFVMSSEVSREFVEKYTDMLNFLIPNYISEGKNQLVVSVGCTGGMHRSVALANAIAAGLQKTGTCEVRVRHRDIGKDPVHKGA
ncbi:MAG: RNase adapter RapZ [Lachnospiraceae bacterium]|nr:RNase adapter RapZ [Lachnospiraceae bacterium]